MKKRKRRLNTLGRILVILVILCVIVLGFLGFTLIQRSKAKQALVQEEKTTEEQKQDPSSEEDGLSSREQAYAQANPDLSLDEVKKRVGMRLDEEPYANVETITDLDSITQLVNKYYGLPSDYEPSDLVPVSSSGENGTVLMREEAANAFEELVNASYQEGFILNACSAYRSYSYQEGLYNNGVANYGQEYADSYWTRPGNSEHQTGLSVDIRMDNDLSDLDAVRYNTHYSWLLEHMAEYGFILRYPDDKEEYTLIAPESWHLRYVGKEAAQEIMDNGWCLEEYIYYHGQE